MRTNGIKATAPTTPPIIDKRHELEEGVGEEDIVGEDNDFVGVGKEDTSGEDVGEDVVGATARFGLLID